MLNPSPLADALHAIDHGLLVDGSHPPAAGDMPATSQATLVEVLRGTLGHSPSATKGCPNLGAIWNVPAVASGGLFHNGDLHQLLQYQWLGSFSAAALTF